jgi:hypothetical protein
MVYEGWVGGEGVNEVEIGGSVGDIDMTVKNTLSDGK